MAGKKKTKVAANPARGFATSSIVSKAKIEKITAVEPHLPENIPSDDTRPHLAAETALDQLPDTLHDRELSQLSPDELEARLEIAELQNIVDKHAVQVKKDAARQVSRLQADRRVLRAQAEWPSVSDWLSDQAMQELLHLLEHQDQPEQSVNSSVVKPLSEENQIIRLWKLRQVLQDLHLEESRISDVLNHVLSLPNLDDASSTNLWGVQTAMQWLATHCDYTQWPDYDTHQHHPRTSDALPESSESEDNFTPKSQLSRTTPTPIAARPASSSEEESDVSDLDSEIEPDQMVEIYLRTKQRLHTKDARLVGETALAGPRIRNNALDAKPPRLSRGDRKLQQRLNALESDVLFDKGIADLKWQDHKKQLLAQHHEKLRLGMLDRPTMQTRQSQEPTAQNVNQPKTNTVSAPDSSAPNSDSEMLGGMFASLDANSPPVAADQPVVTIRNFGKLVGMSARRILEDACKSRDSGVQLRYKVISPTTYSCRHQLVLSWSKKVSAITQSCQGFSVKAKGRSVTIEMTSVAAPDSAQSEAYISTVALYLMFSQSVKDEKLSLRLAPPLRDLWQELMLVKQEATDAVDRDLVKNLRDLVLKQRELAEEEDVVLTSSFRNRSKPNSGVATPLAVTPPSSDATPDHDLVLAWNAKSYTPSYQRMLAARKSLPMYSFKDTALQTIRDNQVTILCGETGCGKSTQMPSFILEDQLSQGRTCNIYCTEPRRISAISLAQRVSEELGEGRNAVGTNHSLVGYAIRLESNTSASTRLVFATVGIVLRMLESEKGLNNITHLMIDEVHERSIDTDFLLVILRALMVRRPDLRVVLMSATVDAARFSEYLGRAPIINVPGRTFPVKTMFLEDALELTGYVPDNNNKGHDDASDVDDRDTDKKSTNGALSGYKAKTIKTLATFDEYRIDYGLIVKLLETIAYDPSFKDFSKAVLVFLPGLAEIRRVNDMLGSHPAFAQGWRVYPLHSNFSSEDQQQAFLVPPRGTRKIVLATNIAETGITIPDVTCVIDTGKHKEMRFDEKRQMSRLIQSFISKANAKQRRGRAGRVQEGICFHLFTKSRHDDIMADQQSPEILRLSLQDLVIRVKICKLGNIEHVLSSALDPPSSKNIRRAIDALIEVKALTSGEELTAIGHQLAKLPLDAQLGKLLLLGCSFGCLDFALTTAAISSSKSPFLNPMGAKRQADTVRLGFRRGDSDLLTAYNAYVSWRRVCTTTSSYENQYCTKNFLSPQNLANIEELKAQLLSSLVDAGFVQLGPDERNALGRVRGGGASRHRNFVSVPNAYNASDDNDSLINAVTAWSFYPKILARQGNGWRSITNNSSISLQPTSINKLAVSPTFEQVRYLSFYSIMQSSSRFTNAQEVSPAADIPLLLLAGDAVFNLYAGVIIIDGNRLRFKIRDWKTMVALQALRRNMQEIVARMMKSPGVLLTERQSAWWNFFMSIFERNVASAKGSAKQGNGKK